jgi:hypothetical protein
VAQNLELDQAASRLNLSGFVESVSPYGLPLARRRPLVAEVPQGPARIQVPTVGQVWELVGARAPRERL